MRHIMPVVCLTEEYCSVRLKTQAHIALQSDSVARDERYCFCLLFTFFVIQFLCWCC